MTVEMMTESTRSVSVNWWLGHRWSPLEDRTSAYPANPLMEEPIVAGRAAPGYYDLEDILGAPPSTSGGTWEDARNLARSNDLALVAAKQPTGYRVAFRPLLVDLVVRISRARYDIQCRDDGQGRVASLQAPAEARQEGAPSVAVRQTTPWEEQLRELKASASLTHAELAELLGVSRTTVQAWLAGGGMRRSNRMHLREVLAVVADARSRLGDTARTYQALMSKITATGLRPFDYLARRRYLIARGFLQEAGVESHLARTERRAPFRPSVELPLYDRLLTLEELGPSPRIDMEGG